MEKIKPIYWYQGLFLQPHHFQLQDRYLDASFAYRTRQIGPHYWGVGGLEIDEAELQNEIFSLRKGELIFPDGTWVDVPANGHVSARSFKKTGYKDGQPLTVYLGVAKWKASDDNVTEIDPAKVKTSANTRFVCSTIPEEVRNQYQGETTTQIRLMDYEVRILWGDEAEAMTDYQLIPVARVFYDGKEVKQADDFIPPVFTLSGSKILLQTMQNIREQIFTCCRQLEKYKIPADSKRSELSQGYILYVLILQSLSKYVPLLYHVTTDSTVHPWVIYGALRQLVGELSTYTDQIDVLGRFEDGEELLPPYNHENLASCFQKAQKNIGDLLHALLFVPEHVVALTRDESLFTAEIPAEAFAPKNEFYLSISTGEETEDLVSTVEEFVKISSSENIQTLIDRSLLGVPFTYTDRPLQVLPKGPGRYYFKIETGHDQWREVKDKKNMAIFWLDAPETAVVEVFILS